jgi:hypothetical protein
MWGEGKLVEYEHILKDSGVAQRLILFLQGVDPRSLRSALSLSLSADRAVPAHDSYVSRTKCKYMDD